MKMNYLLKSKSKKPISWKTIIVIFIFLLLLSFRFLFPNLLRGTLSTLARPIWLMRERVIIGFSLMADFFRLKNTIVNENLALKDELTSLKLKQIDYDALFKENEDLKNRKG